MGVKASVLLRHESICDVSGERAGLDIVVRGVRERLAVRVQHDGNSLCGGKESGIELYIRGFRPEPRVTSQKQSPRDENEDGKDDARG